MIEKAFFLSVVSVSLWAFIAIIYIISIFHIFHDV